MEQPKISVIIPIYNVDSYIAKCLESVINQSYKNLEIIIINDGSTDKTKDICEHYANTDNRIVLVNQNNQGISMARNKGLDMAAGEYIGFVDGDDWIDRDMYELLYKNLCKYDSDISMCKFVFINENGDLLYQRYDLQERSVIYLENQEKMSNFIESEKNYLWNKLYKKDLFNHIRFPKNKLFEDVFISCKLIDKANRIVISSEHKYYYLRRNNSITTQTFNVQSLDIIEGYIERYNYVTKKYPGLEPVCRNHILRHLIKCLYNAYTGNNINLYIKNIKDTVNMVKEYNIYQCGLTKEQEKILELLFKDINIFITAIKIFANQYKNFETNA